jgi:MOSC domain-containing protein YiiM
MNVRISVLAGALAPLGPKGIPSGIVKSPIAAPALLGANGLEGDAQGDTRVHGGPEKAVLHYAFDHYADWHAEIGDAPPLKGPGAFGENISSTGLTESAVAVGDVFRLGSARVQVSQVRQPCWKLNARFGVADMARRVQTTGRTGWYYRVLEPGRLAPEDEMELLDRAAPDWTISRIQRVFYRDTLNRDELEAMAALDVLPENVRARARSRLESGRVEDWSPRLWGDAKPAP